MDNILCCILGIIGLPPPHLLVAHKVGKMANNLEMDRDLREGGVFFSERPTLFLEKMHNSE